ncbi:MAG: hypothetical protein ABJD07_06790 [Gemmatimonadaceae bacterium]
MRRVLLAVAIAIAGIWAVQTIYAGLIVPRLPSWQSVPLAWTALEYLPLLVAALAIGFLPRSWGEIGVLSAALAVATTLFGFLMAYSRWTGSGMGLQLERPLLATVASPVGFFVLWGAWLSVMFLVRQRAGHASTDWKI